MKCKRVDRMLVAYLDGEVTRAERAEIEAHLVGCAACAGELASMQAVRHQIGTTLRAVAATATPSAQAWDRTRERLSQRSRSLRWERRIAWPSPFRPSVRTALVGSALVLLLAVIIVAFYPGGLTALAQEGVRRVPRFVWVPAQDGDGRIRFKWLPPQEVTVHLRSGKFIRMGRGRFELTLSPEPPPTATTHGWWGGRLTGKWTLRLGPPPTVTPSREAVHNLVSLVEAQRQVDFHIYAPAHLPEDLALVGVEVGGSDSVWLRYEGGGTIRSIDLQQTRLTDEGKPRFALGVIEEGEEKVIRGMVGETETLWLENRPGSVATMVWERDGFAFTMLVSSWRPGLDIDEAVEIAESLQ